MQIEHYRIVFISVGLIGILIFASPSISLLIQPPEGQQFSELYLLGPNHMLDSYPYNIAVGQNYSLYLGVGNHLGSAAYYTVYVKMVNQTDLLPNANSRTPSSVQPIYEYKFFLPNGESMETPLVFSVSEASTHANMLTVTRLLINNLNFNLNKPATWDTNATGFSYGVLCELWVYNNSINAVQFHNRYVNLGLNLREPT